MSTLADFLDKVAADYDMLSKEAARIKLPTLAGVYAERRAEAVARAARVRAEEERLSRLQQEWPTTSLLLRRLCEMFNRIAGPLDAPTKGSDE